MRAEAEIRKVLEQLAKLPGDVFDAVEPMHDVLYWVLEEYADVATFIACWVPGGIDTLESAKPDESD